MDLYVINQTILLRPTKEFGLICLQPIYLIIL